MPSWLFIKLSKYLVIFTAAGLISSAAAALDVVNISVQTDLDDLRKSVTEASLLNTAKRDNLTEPQEILAAANADYGRLLAALYAQGYYSGTINILLDGREAALISPLSVPAKVSAVKVAIDPGPLFRFGQVSISPLAPKTVVPRDFAAASPAKSDLIQEALTAAINGWRDQGYAKAQVSAQKIVADHRSRTLAVSIRIKLGPKLTFGNLNINSESAVRDQAIRRIAGLPSGETFNPEEISKAAERLRRTSAFRSVSLSEAEDVGAQNTVDIDLVLVDEKPRRFGYGAELSSLEGVTLSAFWLHRNAFGGAQRLTVNGEIANIGGETGGIDYSLGVRVERPAAFGPDTKIFAELEAERLDEPAFRSDSISLGFGAVRTVSKELELELGFALSYADVFDSFGSRNFTLLSFPAAATFDRRNSVLDATRGYYLALDLVPFIGLRGSQSGLRTKLDARAYRALGQNEGIVLAARGQFGSVAGSSIAATPPDFLFYSGGGGTVRGQGYQSLNVDLGGGNTSGGRSFVGLSAEVRAAINETFSIVGFADAGYIGPESFFDGSGKWHSGAGLGVRYKTTFGPIRFDVAAPTSGTTGSGVQLYVGIGQAF